MNQPINLVDLESIINSLLSEGKCACHFINPHKTRILMWKSKANTYHLRIGIQKFISQEQKDRHGETYWRYYAYELNAGEKENPAPTNLDSIAKASLYAQSNPESSVNSATV